MITSRFLTEDDYPLLAESLSTDEYHKETALGFFLEEGTVTSVFEDVDGPVLFVRGQPLIHSEHQRFKMIRLDIQFLNNLNAKRNMKTMLTGFPLLEQRAKENGFTGFIFMSTAPFLRKFCVRRLGFLECGYEFLVKVLQEDLQEVLQDDKVDEQTEDVL